MDFKLDARKLSIDLLHVSHLRIEVSGSGHVDMNDVVLINRYPTLYNFVDDSTSGDHHSSFHSGEQDSVSSQTFLTKSDRFSVLSALEDDNKFPIPFFLRILPTPRSCLFCLSFSSSVNFLELQVALTVQF